MINNSLSVHPSINYYLQQQIMFQIPDTPQVKIIWTILVQIANPNPNLALIP